MLTENNSGSEEAGTITPSKTRLSFMALAVVKPGLRAEAVEAQPEVMVLDFMFATKGDSDLVEQCGRVDRQLKALEKWFEAAKDVLKSRLPVPDTIGTNTETFGENWKAVYSRENRIDIDRESVKRDMGEEWYGQHCKETPILKLQFKPAV